MEGNLKQLVFERGLVKSSLTRMKTNLANATGEDELEQLELGLERATPLIDKFSDIQDRIEAIVANTEQRALQEEERVQFEKAYFALVSMTRKRVKQLNIENQPPATPSIQTNPSPITAFESQGRLMSPLITLPKFNGSYNKWAKFRDTFEALVHRSSAFTNPEKFNFLNLALEGDAARIIDSLGLDEDSYSIAWQSVRDNFDDPKIMIHHHVKALVNLRSLTSSSPNELRQLKYDASNHCKSLNSLLPTAEQVGESIIIYLLVKKLDPLSRDEWEKHNDNLTEQARLEHFFHFLEKRFKFLERTDTSSRRTPITPGKRPNRGLPERTSSHVTGNSGTCGMCEATHPLYHCEQFKALSPADRLGKARQLNICMNCLQPGHQATRCTRGSCWVCSGNHHTLLHLPLASIESPHTSPGTNNTHNSEHSVALHQVSTSDFLQIETTQGLLSTAIVLVRDRAGRKQECRALLDPGSQTNFITAECHKKLRLPATPANIEITGIGQTACRAARRCSLTLSSRSTNYQRVTSCIIIPSITQAVPRTAINRALLPIPNNIGLADPKFHSPGEIELLIGVEVFWDLICVGQIKLGRNLPVLQKTLLGWIVGGSLPIPRSVESQIGSSHVGTLRDLNETIAKFWEVEQCETNSHSPIDPSDPCEKHFHETTTRESNGRYMVSIPLKRYPSTLGDSRQMAEKRFHALERKFRRDSQLREAYTSFMAEYEQLGHMSLISPSQIDVSHSFYLPHHAVRKEASTTTKLRVVFDGSAKSSSGVSLNDIQLVGPTVQDELISILLRFRKHRYVISADISKMYRQILVKPKDRSLQRILWRPREDVPLRTYELNTVTYGTASASYLATRTLRHVGEQHAIKFPIASRAVLKDFYVDDLLTGSDSIEGARQLRTDISTLLDSAGFELRKWASNEPRVLINESNPSVKIHADKDPRTLGLVWDADSDTLKYAIKICRHERRASKRIILSDIAQIFDPLGLIGPAILQAKLILQRLWQLKVNWDESLPQDLAHQWQIFREELSLLDKIEIPRRLFNLAPISIQLHGFCDASERAYGACIYLRVLCPRGQCAVQLVCAKSRVSPLKAISLPRLELCGALLLAQLATKTISSLELEIKSRHFWTDSMVTLAWIQAPSTKWTTFVANRVSEIQRLTGDNTWRHVPTSSNPADIISRGVSPVALASAKMWWEGPEWLRLPQREWPISRNTLRDLPEARTVSLVGTAPLADLEIIHRFSSFTHFIRVTAYCLRFISNTRARLRHKTSTALEFQSGPLTVNEITRTTNAVVRVVQATAFGEEFRTLSKGNKISRSSPLSDLHPFLDETGLLRVGGRLSNAPIPYTQKHPAILSSSHAFTELLIDSEHKRLFHAGCQAVLSSLRARYWIISGKNAVKKVLRKCIRCFRVKPKSIQQIMGILPSSRVTPARAFHTCGVDYAGPLLMKEGGRGRTTLKGYLCLFVCLVTKAVHMELATSLNTDAFLNCLKRFISRRGLCNNIYSDNGTNFIGARNELKELAMLLRSDQHNRRVAEFLSSKEIQWHFIPPRSPHFGGLWEAAIKSAKYHLKRVIGETRLSYEELYTLLTQVEACMNSRPLSSLSTDPKDLNPLTPAHFLIGDSLISFPQPDIRDIKTSLLSRYQHIQYMLQHFWQRWQREYLHQLQQRTKWRSPQAVELKPGSLVVIKDEALPPLRWRLGRIDELHPGRDKITRVATIRTSDVTANHPPQRPWIPLTRPNRTRPTCIFTVMCYNVLCDKYATRQMYGYCPSWALDWEYRKKGILDEIRHYAADIISLQEVETDQFYNFFLPELKNDGYDGIFSPKSRAKTMAENDRKYVDGCAIFYRTAKFTLIKEHLVEFNQLAMANAEGSDNMLNRVMPKDNIGLAALLRTKEAAWDNGLPSDPAQVQQPILVCTAHIFWDPEFCDVKLIQTMMLSNELRSILDQAGQSFRPGHKPDSSNVQLLLCGDFNSLPDSGVIEFLTSGRVAADHRDFKDLAYKSCLQKISGCDKPNEFTHSFKLASAYSEDIMPYTNYTFDFKGIIDYIFYSKQSMVPLGLLGPLSADWFREHKVVGCPHPHIPSDHFPLLVELEMTPTVGTSNGLISRR